VGARIGVLALQGASARHVEALTEVGAEAVPVRTPADLDRLDGLVIPGGESTTISHLLGTSGLHEPLADALADGLPALGTCAGMILLAADVTDGRADQRSFGAIDIGVRRNAFGRQNDSFEAELDLVGIEGGPMHAVFIRAPVVDRVGAGVEVLASVDAGPVVCRSGAIMVCSFHPELGEDHRLHATFLEGV
jgi:5'-phosphate synthase pdxT subunit